MVGYGWHTFLFWFILAQPRKREAASTVKSSLEMVMLASRECLRTSSTLTSLMMRGEATSGLNLETNT